MNESNFFAELKRRNVYKVAVTYLVASWLPIQIATKVFPVFQIPNWAVRLGWRSAVGCIFAHRGSCRRPTEMNPHNFISALKQERGTPKS